jgi:hypothetical protein
MKKIIFLTLFAIPIFCRAQTDTTNYQKKIAYCIVEIDTRGSNYLASLDDGTITKASAMEIKDSKGKQIKFTSRIAVLDYMTQRGWTLASSYYTSSRVETMLGLVFKKPVDANIH